ncbi:hypothetical protein AKJ16_DCAP06954 [Drosera capensis]
MWHKQIAVERATGETFRRRPSRLAGKLPHPSDLTSYVPRKSGASLPLQNLPVGIPPKKFFPYGGKFARKIESVISVREQHTKNEVKARKDWKNHDQMSQETYLDDGDESSCIVTGPSLIRLT